MKKSTKKLAFQPQTLRVLAREELAEVGAAWGILTTFCTVVYCPQSGSPLCERQTVFTTNNG